MITSMPDYKKMKKGRNINPSHAWSLPQVLHFNERLIWADQAVQQRGAVVAQPNRGFFLEIVNF